MVCLLPTSSSLNLSYVPNTDVISRCVFHFSAFHDPVYHNLIWKIYYRNKSTVLYTGIYIGKK